MMTWKFLWQVLFIVGFVMFIYMFIHFSKRGYRELIELLKDRDEG